jgi:hypothetical protein
MSTHSGIFEKTKTGYRGIYCHFDGYLSGVGSILLQYYNTPEKVKQLIDLGSISSLNTTIYDTVAYHRDRGEDYERNAPFYYDDEEWNIAQVIDYFTASYIYVFQDGVWFVNGEKV